MPRRSAYGRTLRDELLRGFLQAGARHRSIDQPTGDRLTRRQHASGQHQIQCERRTKGLHCANRSTETRVDAELNLGQAKGTLVALDSYSIVARQRQLEATTQSESIDRRDSRHAKLAEARQQRLSTRRELFTLSRIFDAGEFLDVGTNDKARALAGLEHETAKLQLPERRELVVKLG
jgi:hypothetical protein